MKQHLFALTVAAIAGAALTPAPAAAQATDPYLGELIVVPYTFCPNGWMDAAGQLLPINTNTALFSLLGTQYGGNGTTNFALPDLRSRTVTGTGQGPGLSNYDMGQTGGSETQTLTVNQMPAHTHTALIKVQPSAADSATPVRSSFAISQVNTYSTSDPATNYMKQSTVEVRPSGGSQPFPTLPPYLTLRWCIAVQGVFPSRP